MLAGSPAHAAAIWMGQQVVAGLAAPASFTCPVALPQDSTGTAGQPSSSPTVSRLVAFMGSLDSVWTQGTKPQLHGSLHAG